MSGDVVTDISVFDACYEVVCDICCWDGHCVTDEIICQVEAKSDFNTVGILIIVIACLLIGI